MPYSGFLRWSLILSSKGVYSQLLQLPPTADHPGKWRHMHVLEVSLLNGVPLNLDWGTHQRLNLCAVGQMAAPMQSVWIAAALARHVQTLLTHVQPVDPLQLLNALKHEVLLQGKQLYPDVPSDPVMPARCALAVHEPGQGSWTLEFHPSATVKALILAHSRLHQVPLDDVWVRDSNNELVSHEIPLATFQSLTIGRSVDMFPVEKPSPQMHVLPLTDADFDPPAQPVTITQLDVVGDDVIEEVGPPEAPDQAPMPVVPVQRNQDRTVASLFGLDPLTSLCSNSHRLFWMLSSVTR